MSSSENTEERPERGQRPLSVFRAVSPSPSISPSRAASPCPSPDQSFSTISTASTYSSNSGDGRFGSSASTKRRGYIRPQGVEFAPSAKNRESVMCLGSIAHLQYYFARTGLLDGKGGVLAPTQYKKGTKDIPKLTINQEPEYAQDLVESPADEFAADPGYEEEDEEVMLPPTVSTYSVKPHNVPPPPDMRKLRKDLVEALDKASLAVKTSESEPEPEGNAGQQQQPPPQPATESQDESSDQNKEKPMSWHEVQGMRILDLVTLAIRAARIYYTSHEHPERLAAIKSERQIREELFSVLEVLKAWASRNFAGGLRNNERSTILEWMAGVLSMLDEDRRLEELENKERASWVWASGDWTGREREREEAFLQTLIRDVGEPLPKWTSPDEGPLPTPFLERLRDGRDLIRIHNQAVRKSRRLFGQIKTPHEDIGKPYRRAENLRYWKKAAELRWEVKLDFDVMGVVYGSSDEAWKQFDAALMTWCREVREEMVLDWRSQRKGSMASVASIPMFTLSGTGDDS
ncbi:hypothetical protein VTN49DRAFT_3445 [Thermomyces lanuginosus]|uniref:uncharacterized protein n=1 Tax=Thermomyces lanuginosus TaxID=5541 RepID=UPI003744275A